jgi:hypothetical protein
MPKTKRDIIVMAIHAYADPYDPDGPNPGNEIVDKVIEFLETCGGLDLESLFPASSKEWEPSDAN